MGRFVNPDNQAFKMALNSEIYVDKSGLINFTNKLLCTGDNRICNSRPRRFGKSMTANMLSAYYSKGADSKEMFSSLEIGSSPDFEKHLNKYDVIHLDIQECIDPAGGPEKVVSYINREVIRELKKYYPEDVKENEKSLVMALSDINLKRRNQFVIIIDEWDVLVRDYADNLRLQNDYFMLLGVLFKGLISNSILALGYMTGILPVKKQISQSGMNNFDMYSFVSPGAFAEYMGFTEEEVISLCDRYGMNADDVKRQYGSYRLEQWNVYNPMEIVDVMMWGDFNSYWCNTCSSEVVSDLITLDLDDLMMSVLRLLAGSEVPVDVSSFNNDPADFSFADDVLTYLIHLGYLGYNSDNGTAFIPNEEIREEMGYAVGSNPWKEMVAFATQSQLILDSTLAKDSRTVAEAVEKIHDEYVPGVKYNDENSLSSVLTLAYLSARQYYFKPIRELPAGKGFADFVYIPKPRYMSQYPALIVELKWNKDAESAIDQIRKKRYPDSIKEYTDNILLVGINYDKKTKKHECIIEKL